MPRFETPAPQATTEASDVRQWESQLSDTPDTNENIETTEITPIAGRIENAANRVSDYMRNRASNKLKKESQDEAYDSYSENIDTTTNRERAEQLQNAKDTVKGLGVKTFKAVRASWAKTKSASETAALFALYSPEAAKNKARSVIANRAEKAKARDDAELIENDHAEALDEYDEREQNNELGGSESVIDEAYETNKDMQWDEAIATNNEIDDAAQAERNAELAKQIADRARARKAERKLAIKARRQATFNSVKETVQTGVDTTKDVVREKAANAKEDLAYYAEGTKNAVLDTFDEGVDSMRDAADYAKNKYQDAKEVAKDNINKGKEFAVDLPRVTRQKIGRIAARLARRPRAAASKTRAAASKTRHAVRTGYEAAKASYQE